MLLVVPKGQSLRAVAERLGVAVEELQRHSAVKDVDAPAPVEQRLEVPDGFLRSQRGKVELTDAVASPSGKRGGMNMWLALDIEQKRTRAAGGMKAHQMRDSDAEALDEALRTYLRFEAASNDLAADLFQQLTITTSIEVRARAFAGLGLAQAQRNLIFNRPPERCRPMALSSAKAAQLANPKLGDAHLAMALALQIAASPSDYDEAREELHRACELETDSVTCWSELARLELRLGNRDAARAATESALQVGPTFVLAVEADALLLAADGEHAIAIQRLRQATATTETYADAWAHLAALLRAAGQREEFAQIAETARTHAVSAEHLRRVEDLILREV